MSSPDVVRTTGGVLKTKAGDLPVAVYLHYTTTDPVALAMTLVASLEMPSGCMFSDQQTWVFGRNLVDQAISTYLPHGDGDVKVEYLAVADLVRIDLTDVHGDTTPLLLEAEPVIDFMAETFALVPVNSEIVDVDEAIERLLSGSWSVGEDSL